MTTSPPLEEGLKDSGGLFAKDESLPGAVGDRKKDSSLSVVLLGFGVLVFLGLLVGGFLYMKGGKTPEETTRSLTLGSLPSEELVFDGAGEEAIALLKKFFEAPTAEEKSKFIINGESLLGELKNYYREGIPPLEDIRAEFFSEVGIERGDRDRGIYLLEYHRPKQFKMSEFFTPIIKFEVRINVEEADIFTKARGLQENYEMEAMRAHVYFKRVNDALLFDWSTFVQTKDRLLRSFVRFPVAGKKQIFRVGISEDATSLFARDASKRAFRIFDGAHSGDDAIVVEVPKDSEVGKILESLAWSDKKGVAPFAKSATIELEWSSDAVPILSISRVICWEFLDVGGDPSNLNEGR